MPSLCPPHARRSWDPRSAHCLSLGGPWPGPRLPGGSRGGTRERWGRNGAAGEPPQGGLPAPRRTCRLLGKPPFSSAPQLRPPAGSRTALPRSSPKQTRFTGKNNSALNCAVTEPGAAASGAGKAGEETGTSPPANLRTGKIQQLLIPKLIRCLWGRSVLDAPERPSARGAPAAPGGSCCSAGLSCWHVRGPAGKEHPKKQNFRAVEEGRAAPTSLGGLFPSLGGQFGSPNWQKTSRCPCSLPSLRPDGKLRNQ